MTRAGLEHWTAASQIKYVYYLLVKQHMHSRALFAFFPKVRLQNPSTKPLVYQVLLAGKDAVDFYLPMGDTIQVSY